MALTRERLRSLLLYDPATGIFEWLPGTKRRGAPKDRRAVRIDPDGYWTIKIDYKDYRAARLAVLWMTGRWPKHQVDHKNRIRSDDRWINLRSATNQQNAANRSSASGRGVRLDRGKYISRIQVNRRSIWLGRFDNFEEAKTAYIAASSRYFGEFAN